MREMEEEFMHTMGEDGINDMNVENAPAEAVSRVYLFLGWCFSYPEEDLFNACTQEGAMEEALEELRVGLPFDVEFQGVPRFSTPLEKVQTLYTSMFDIPLCPIPMQETVFRRGEMSRDDINEGLTRFFEYFGVELTGEARDFPDHLSVELEFMAHLARKERDALTQGKTPTPLRLAQRDFLARHLCKWFKRLNHKFQKLLVFTEEPFYPQLGNLTSAFLENHLVYLRDTLREEPPVQVSNIR